MTWSGSAGAVFESHCCFRNWICDLPRGDCIRYLISSTILLSVLHKHVDTYAWCMHSVTREIHFLAGHLQILKRDWGILKISKGRQARYNVWAVSPRVVRIRKHACIRTSDTHKHTHTSIHINMSISPLLLSTFRCCQLTHTYTRIYMYTPKSISARIGTTLFPHTLTHRFNHTHTHTHEWERGEMMHFAYRMCYSALWRTNQNMFALK